MGFGTNDSITSGTQFPMPGGSVDGNSPRARSKKGVKIKIGGHIETDYPLSAVMLSQRGDEHQVREQHREMNGRSQIAPSETPKKGTFGNTPSHNIGTHQTPSFGAVVRG
jgi:hypothetical protein